MRPLRIAQVSPLWASVPPAGYGGAELVVHWLTEELVRRGHRVTLFASGDSRTAAELVPLCDLNLLDAMAAGSAFSYEPYAAAAAAEALRRALDFDVVHCHLGPAAIPLSVLSPVPVVHTVHAGLDAADERWLVERYPECEIAGISRSQIAALPPERRERIPVVYHGCDLSAYRPSFETGHYLAFVGRMGAHKNPAGAIEIAIACGLPIRLAGLPQDETERRYFDERVRPLVDGDRVVHLGAVSHEEKVELLRGAAALVFPIEWEEHFGLVMIEAMACGTPVVAHRRGSVPEVVEPGVTGCIGESPAQLAELVAEALALDRRAIRKRAEARFGHRRMANDYLAIYRALLAGRPLRKES